MCWLKLTKLLFTHYVYVLCTNNISSDTFFTMEFTNQIIAFYIINRSISYEGSVGYNKWTSETLISISLRVLHENDSVIEDTHDNTLSA